MLLPAKILVISRLLHKKLAQHLKPPPYLETLRNRLTALRCRLLIKIDSRFKNLDITADVLVEAMCAFSLATSSSPTDVLRHFHYVRQEAMSEQRHQTSSGQARSLQALQIYIKTLKDTQTLVPGQLARALERLKSIPLFKSADLHALLELNLDVHERLIGEDIKTFKPYIRQDDLQRPETERLLSLWAKQAFADFLIGLEDRIQDIDNPLIIVQLRKEVLELWFSNSQHAVGINVKEALDGLRNTFNNQLMLLVQRQVASLTEVGSTIQSTLRNWNADASGPTLSLWDPSITSMETSRGAKAFRETLLFTINSRTTSLQSVSTQYMTWLTRISAIEDTIKTLRSATWEDDFEDIEDDDDLLPTKQTLLSSDDPRALQKELSNSLTSAFRSLESSLKISPSTTDEHERGRISAYLLRIFREVRQHFPSSYEDPGLGLDSILKLHDILTEVALRIPWQECQRRMKSRKLAGRQLWEGNPELPILPSPWAFRFLKDLESFMTEFGTDVWSPSATDMLKRNVRGKLAFDFNNQYGSAAKANGYSIVENRDTEEAKKVNGNSPSQPPVNATNLTDVRIQRVFDALFLMHAITPRNPTKTVEKEEDLFETSYAHMREAVELNRETAERIEKGAEEYWKRTGMLFGLLG